MLRGNEPQHPPGSSPVVRRSLRIPDILIGILLFIVILVVSQMFLGYMGLRFYVVALGGLVTVIVLGYASLKEMSFALVLWLTVMSGFRWVGMVNMPGLPDLSLDRILLVWIIVMFLLRIIVFGERLRGPYLAEFLLLCHVIYILVQMQFIGTGNHFHHWVLSMFTPFFGFIYGKYTIRRDAEVRNLLLFFLVLSVYYFCMSIFQHYGIDALIWPKTILDKSNGLWHHGRSRGPVLHPPMFGQLIAMLIMVYIYFLARVKSTALKFATLVGLGLTGLGSLFTFTRGPWVAIVAGLGVMALMSNKNRRIVAVLAVIGLLGALLGVLQMADSDFLQERMANTDTIENRLGFLANATRAFRDHPLFGVGYFRWMEVLGEYNQTTEIPFYGTIRKNMSAHVPIHDIYLGRFAEEGLVGAGLQWAFYIAVFRVFVRKWRTGIWSPWFDRETMVLFAGMMVCYMVGGMVIDYRYFDLINVIFYLLAGVIVGFDPAEARQHGEKAEAAAGASVGYLAQ